MLPLKITVLLLFWCCFVTHLYVSLHNDGYCSGACSAPSLPTIKGWCSVPTQLCVTHTKRTWSYFDPEPMGNSFCFQRSGLRGKCSTRGISHAPLWVSRGECVVVCGLCTPVGSDLYAPLFLKLDQWKQFSFGRICTPMWCVHLDWLSQRA